MFYVFFEWETVCTSNQIEQNISLPQELVKVLTAKSTKKESTKFGYKIAELLKWIDGDPVKQEMTGLKQVIPGRIHVKRASLAATFQIQNDSLLINFRRNDFQLVGSEDNWYVYALPGDFQMHQNESKPESSRPTTASRVAMHVSLPARELSFAAQAREKWNIIVDDRNVQMIEKNKFMERVIDVFEIVTLSRNDMFYLLSMVTFTSLPGIVNFSDFIRLYANFGEKNGIFPKILSLMKCISEHDQWLSFTCVSSEAELQKTGMTAAFYNGPSFGIMLAMKNGELKFVKNDFSVPFFSEYLVDDTGNRYHSWDEVLALI